MTIEGKWLLKTTSPITSQVWQPSTFRCGEGIRWRPEKLSREASSHLLTEAMEAFGGLILSWISQELSHPTRWREACVRPLAHSSGLNLNCLDTPQPRLASHCAMYAWGVHCHKEELSHILAMTPRSFLWEGQRREMKTVRLTELTELF